MKKEKINKALTAVLWGFVAVLLSILSSEFWAVLSNWFTF